MCFWLEDVATILLLSYPCDPASFPRSRSTCRSYMTLVCFKNANPPPMSFWLEDVATNLPGSHPCASASFPPLSKLNMPSLYDFGAFQRESQAYHVAWLEDMALNASTIMPCSAPSAFPVKIPRRHADGWTLVCFNDVAENSMSFLAGRRD
jgi:hypothetical protein